MQDDPTLGGFVVAGGYVDFIATKSRGPHTSSLIKVPWQDGAVTPSIGANGVTPEAMITAAIDRLKCFQETRLKCRETEVAIMKLEEAHHWLLARIEDRRSRGVLNTNEV